MRNRIVQTILLIVVLLFIFITCTKNPATSEKDGIRLFDLSIHSPSLMNNIFDPIQSNNIAVYLPPSYHNSEQRYPVVYFLPGFSTRYSDFLNGTFQGFRLLDAVDQLIQAGEIDEMIIVIPNDDTFLEGCFYVNSPVRGNWEDFIVEDLVQYVDTHYRTLAQSTSRGIAGHSMGGFGALNLAMRHPELFCATYGLCAGLFDLYGLEDQGMFSNADIQTHLGYQDIWDNMDEGEAVSAFIAYIDALKSHDSHQVFSYAYGAAFSPDAEGHPPYIDYPYSLSQTGQILVDSALVQNYFNGFGGWAEKVDTYKENLLNLKAIVIDYGTADAYAWIQCGSEYLSQCLQGAQIPHRLTSFNGTHSSRVRDRIENAILPFFSDQLEFE